MVYNKKKILVHCWAGVSRSATIVLNYIIKRIIKNHDVNGVDIEFIVTYALNILRSKRPIIAPNVSFIQQLERRAFEYKRDKRNQEKIDANNCELCKLR